MSLATKISLLVTLFLGVCGAAAGTAFHDAVRRSVDAELESRLQVRLAWIEAGLALEEEGLEFDAQGEPRNAAESWSVSRPGGRVLLRSPDDPPDGGEGQRVLRRNVTLAPQEDWPWAPDGGDAGEAVPGAGARPSVQLVIAAGTDTKDAQAELERLRAALLTVGPLALAATAGILVLLIRWQLSPLRRMAREAGRISPGDLSVRLPAPGSAREYAQLGNALNAMVERLADGLERERRFSSTAAHELRTPLAQLKTVVEVALRRDRDAAEYRDALADVRADVERLEKLVDGLLRITRNLRPEGMRGAPVRVDALVGRAVRSAGAAGTDLSGLGGGAAVVGDEELLASALANVLENARRHAPGTRPEIRAHREGSRVVLDVTDGGPGVPPEARERIFEPLTRLDAARTVGDRADGFGLGLAVARSTARAFGGDLVCTARPDGEPGARFRFELAAAP